MREAPDAAGLDQGQKRADMASTLTVTGLASAPRVVLNGEYLPQLTVVTRGARAAGYGIPLYSEVSR